MTQTETTPWPATTAQTSFIKSLLKERTGYSDGFAVRTLAALEAGTLPKPKASEIITWLLAKEKRAVETVAVDGIDLSALEKFTCKGLVRVAVPGGDTRLKLRVQFQKDNVTKKLKAIWVNDAAVYGHGTLYGVQKPGNSYRGKVEAELTAILKDPAAAIIRYTEITGKCGICNLPLEVESSVARGIGPVCAKKLGLL